MNPDQLISTWYSKLYTRLLKLPLSSPIAHLILQLLNAQNHFMNANLTTHLHLLVQLTSSSLDILTNKLIKSSTITTKSNAIMILKFFLYGYRIQPNYFLDYIESRYIPAVNALAEMQ